MDQGLPIPQTDEERLAWLRLSRSRNVGPASFLRLLMRYGTPTRALEAMPDLAARGGERAYQVCSERQGAEELARAAAAGAQMLCLGAPDYPLRLGEIADPPPFLWAQGDVTWAQRESIAIVGARNASSMGLRLARLLASDMGARGYVIASGLARGIDAAAHHEAVATGTIAVLAGGVDHIYPAENQTLADAIRERGLLLSEAPMGLKPQGRHFPRRNRIVSGLSQGVVLIEAAQRSGSLITARFALEQGREAMAAPGAPLDPRSSGCNEMIRQGAALIRNADDIEEALAAPRTLAMHAYPGHDDPGVLTPASEVPRDTNAADLVERLAGLIGTAPVDIDAITRDLAADPAHVAEALLELDLAGRIERHPGGMVALSAA
ncbi:MAG: DNA-processing protein DprA [Pikeienuella sp.]